MTTDPGDRMLTTDPRLRQWRRFTDPARGFQEEFLQPEVGGSRLLAVLARPLGDPKPVCWVICHSFGIEQINLGRLEVTVSRNLAAAGFPVLRFSSRGYGDSELSMWETTMDTYLEDATHMVGLARGFDGVEAVGTLGVRFGGLVAGIAADRTGAEYFGSWEPILDGGRFMDQQFRFGSLSAIVGKKSPYPPAKEIKQALATKGWADLAGMALTRRAYEDISKVRLLDEMRSFRGRALLVAVNSVGYASPDLLALAEHIRALGGTCDVAALKHLTGFGRFQHIDGSDDVKVDTLHELTGQISDGVAEWYGSKASSA